MKKLALVFLALTLALGIGCKDDAGSAVNPFGGGGNGGGSVSFTIGTTQGQQGETIFTATPNVNIKITQVTVTLAAQQFNDVIQGDGTTVFNANQPAQISSYTGVGSGQAWTFKFDGTSADDNKAFSVTSNYTVP